MPSRRRSLGGRGGGQKIADETWNFSLTLVRPNKFACGIPGDVISNGTKLYG